VRRSHRLFASKSQEDEEEEITFNPWKLTLKEIRTNWIVYVPGDKKIYNSTFNFIKKTLPLKNIQPHPKNKKIFTFELSKKNVSKFSTKDFKQKEKIYPHRRLL